MKYKVIAFNSDVQEELTGTCDLCYGTAMVENGYVTVEDETGETTDIYLTYWSWGDYFTIDIGNLVDFSTWLQERDVEPIGDCDPWAWLDSLVDDYDYEEELEDEC